MEPEKDWRAENAKIIRGEKLCHKRYKIPRTDWDHDHCVACWGKFDQSDDPVILHEGYATVAESKWGENYHWVCAECFRDLHNIMEWTAIECP